MNRYIITFLLFFLCGSAISHSRSAIDIFADIPSNLIPTLDNITRLDMIDYFNAGLPTPSENSFGGKSRIVSADSTLLVVEISKNSILSLALLHDLSDSIVALISTVKTPTPDSDIKFFRLHDWSQIPVVLPSLADFLSPDAAKQNLLFDDFPPMTFTSIEFSPAENVFIFTDRSRQHFASPSGELPYRALNFFNSSIRRSFRRGKLVDK